MESGTYTFIAKVKDSDFIKKGIFDVKKLQLERIGLVANHQNLKKIALLSSGKLFYPNNLESLINALHKSERNKKSLHSTEKIDSFGSLLKSKEMSPEVSITAEPSETLNEASDE